MLRRRVPIDKKLSGIKQQAIDSIGVNDNLQAAKNILNT
jgi:hypothetical protein